MASQGARTTRPRPAENGLGRRLVANAAANFAGQAILLALAFFATPYIVGRFGASRYAVLILVLSFVNLLSLFQLGFNSGLVKYLSASIDKSDAQETENYLRTALALYLAIGIAVAVGLALATPWLAIHFLHVPHSLRGEATAGLYLAAVAFALQFVAEVFNAVPIAAQRFDVVNGLFVGSEVARIAGSVAVVWLGYLVRAVLGVVVVSSLLFLAGSVAATLWLLPGVRLRPALSNKHLRDLLHFSKFAAISQLATRSGSLDGPILAHLLPTAYVAFYMVPFALCAKIRTLAANVTSVTFPALSALAVPGDAARLRELYLRGTKMVFGLVALPSMALIVTSRAALGDWINPEFARNGARVLEILSAGFFVNSLMHIPDALANGLGRPAIPAGFNTAETFAKYALFFALVPGFGIAGAAAGFLATQIALAPAFIGAASRMVNVGWAELFLRAYLPAACPLCASLIPLVLWQSHIRSLPGLVAALCAASAIYLLLGAAFILDRQERAACLSLLKKRLPLVCPIGQLAFPKSGSKWNSPERNARETSNAPRLLGTCAPSAQSMCSAAVMDLTVTIANWNRADLLEVCLDSVYKTAATMEYEVIVVDNASTDQSAAIVLEKFPQARLVHNQINLGFARAHNQAFALARGRYIAVLNSDAAVLPDTFPTLIRFMDRNPRAGICTCPAIANESGARITGGGIRHFPSLAREIFAGLLAAAAPPFALRNHPMFLKLAEWAVGKSPLPFTRKVPCAGGALLAIRRQMIEEIGAFDEDFFLYFEETDLCRRAGQAGWDVWHVASTSYRHEGHQSSDLRHDIESIFQASGARYFRKHSGRLAAGAFLVQRRILRCWLPRWRSLLGHAARRLAPDRRQAMDIPAATIQLQPGRARRANSSFRVEEERTPWR